MIPVASAIELGVKLVMAGVTALNDRRDNLSEDQIVALQAEFKRHGERWAELLKGS